MLDVGVGIARSTVFAGAVLGAGTAPGDAEGPAFLKNPKMLFCWVADCEETSLGFGLGIDISFPSIPRTMMSGFGHVSKKNGRCAICVQHQNSCTP